MLNQLKVEANKTLTENLAITNETTGSDCLDLFATIGALRNAKDDEIIIRFLKAYTENPDLAMKILFFARDIRFGLGERRVFRVILKWLSKNKPESLLKNIELISEYGRFDDLLSLFGTPCEKQMLEVLKNQYFNDLKALDDGKQISLLGKWLPSVNASDKEKNNYGKRIAKEFGLTEANYRKSLTELRKEIKIIENYLREKDYSFDYAKQPSRAMFKYKKAFLRNDFSDYMKFINNVKHGEAKLNTDNVMPYEIVAFAFNGNYYIADLTDEEKSVLNATWDALPDFGSNENAIAVIDTSGSMYSRVSGPTPATVALSLGLYFAEHNKGVFANHFIEFSNRPQLIEIKGETFADRLKYISSFNKIADTNLEAVFELILNTAVKYNVPQEELPKKLVIISDMEFNQCVINSSETNFENAKKLFNQFGYKLPEIVFWNVASRNRQQPVTKDEKGVILVSGVTPKLFSEILSGKEYSPQKFMIEVLSSERYEKIAA